MKNDSKHRKLLILICLLTTVSSSCQPVTEKLALRVNTVAKLDPESYTQNCPDDFVKINETFCIANNEMTTDGTTTSVTASGARGTSSISQADAQTACELLGSNYSLPTNEEWESMANEIEYVDANWSQGTRGYGYLKYDSSLQTLQGAEVWNLIEGNMEYTSDTVSQDYAINYQEVSSLAVNSPFSALFSSSGNLAWEHISGRGGANDMTTGMLGLVYLDSSHIGRALLRGGSSDSYPGLYTAASFVWGPNGRTGFRCVYRF